MGHIQRALFNVGVVVILLLVTRGNVVAQSFGVRGVTPVKLVLTYPIIFSTAQVGQIVQWQVAEDVIIEGIIALRKGAPATARISTIFPVGTSPDIGMKLESVKLSSGANVRITSGAEPTSGPIIHFASQNSRGAAVREGTEITVFTDWFALDREQGFPSSNVVEHTLASSQQRLIVPDGTPVRLRMSQTISSAEAEVGDHVGLEVLDEVTIGNLIVVPKGGYAWGTVTEAQSKRRLGRGGKLSINLDAVRLASGEKAPLRAVKNTKGGGHTGAMTGAMVATTVVFWPAAPFWLFVQGKDTSMKQGNEIIAYVNGDTPLDPDKWLAVSRPQQTWNTIPVPFSSIGAESNVRRGAFIGASGVTGANGVVLSEVGRDSPAERAGLRVGDTITGLDGKRISTTRTLFNELSSHIPGAKLRVSYIRYGVERVSIITTGTRSDRTNHFKIDLRRC